MIKSRTTAAPTSLCPLGSLSFCFDRALLLCRHIAELIFYMEELRAHVRKYGPVMQRYYVQYLSGFDAVVLNELVQVRIHLHTDWFI